MALFSNLVQRGTRSAQPAATAVDTATIYHVSDEGITERSTGSAWESYSPNLKTAEVSIASAAILTMRATPPTLVAAPGAGKIAQFVDMVLIHDAGTAYVESTANMGVRYTGTSGVQVSETIEATGFIDQATDIMTTARAKLDAIVAKAGCENQPLVLHNLGAGEYTTGTGTLRAKVNYRIITTGW